MLDDPLRGGVYLLAGGKAIKMRRSPQHVYGIAATKDTLYLSTSQSIVAWTDWDGTRYGFRLITEDDAQHWAVWRRIGTS